MKVKKKERLVQMFMTEPEYLKSNAIIMLMTQVRKKLLLVVMEIEG